MHKRMVAWQPQPSQRTRQLPSRYILTSFNEPGNLPPQDQPGNDQLFKRQAALERSRGDTPKAIDLLRKHVDTYCVDAEAWEELSELYLEQYMYRQAAFCYEELLLHAPMNVNYLTRYADVLYTMGGHQNYRCVCSVPRLCLTSCRIIRASCAC